MAKTFEEITHPRGAGVLRLAQPSATHAHALRVGATPLRTMRGVSMSLAAMLFAATRLAAVRLALCVGLAFVATPSLSLAQQPNEKAAKTQAPAAAAPSVQADDTTPPPSPNDIADHDAEPQNLEPVRGPPQLPYAEDESLGVTFVKTMLALGGVLILTYLVLNVGLRRLMGLQASSRPGGLVSIIERVTLEPKKSVYVLRIAEKYVLVGAGENGLTLLQELETESIARALAERPAPLPPGKLIQKLLVRGKKEP